MKLQVGSKYKLKHVANKDWIVLEMLKEVEKGLYLVNVLQSNCIDRNNLGESMIGENSKMFELFDVELIVGTHSEIVYTK